VSSIHSVRQFVLVASAAAVVTAPLTACASLNKTEKGALIGAAAGGAVGAAVGSKNGGTARGAIIGAAVGGAAGALIGRRMDKQAQELARTIPGATVERVGEGIQVTFASGLLYDFDSYTVKPAARENLRNLAASLDEYPDTDLLIAGHTDSVGSDSYNLRLSEQRARAAADYLASQGVDRGRIQTRGLGESEPKASNATDAGRAENRRVEVAIYASEALRQQARSQAGPPGR
jgi:outer membrane protein OmpA-like peptidoglycan-associated protein